MKIKNVKVVVFSSSDETLVCGVKDEKKLRKSWFGKSRNRNIEDYTRNVTKLGNGTVYFIRPEAMIDEGICKI